MVLGRRAVQQGQLQAVIAFPAMRKNIYSTNIWQRRDILPRIVDQKKPVTWINSQGETENWTKFKMVSVVFFFHYNPVTISENEFHKNIYLQNRGWGINVREKIQWQIHLGQKKKAHTVVFMVMHSADEFHWPFDE